MTLSPDIAAWLDEHAPARPPDTAEIDRSAREAVARVRFALSDKDVLETIATVDRTLSDLRQSDRLLALRYYYEDRSDEVAKLREAYAEARLRALTAHADFYASVARSRRKERLAEDVGAPYFEDADRLAICYPRHALPKLLEERALVHRHMERLSSLSLSVDEVGEVHGDVRALLTSSSHTRRARAHRSMCEQIERMSGAMASDMLELHTLRRALAEQAGLPTFYAYATRRAGQSDRFRAEMSTFRELVAHHITPLVAPIRAMQWERMGIAHPEPWDVLRLAPFGLPMLAERALPLDETYLDALRFIFTSPVEMFEAMRDSDTLVLRPAPADRDVSVVEAPPAVFSADTVVSVYAEAIDRTFLLMFNVPEDLFVHRLFYETGGLLFDRATAMRHAMTPVLPTERLARRVAADAMAVLSRRSWGAFYGGMADYARESEMTRWALRLPVLAALDEMEEFLARARVSNDVIFRHAWEEIAERYALPGTRDDRPSLLPLDRLWQLAPAMWRAPLSGILHALSMVTVLGTLPMGRHYQRLETCLTRLLNGTPGLDPIERLEEAGFPSPFEEATVEKAAFSLAYALGL